MSTTGQYLKFRVRGVWDDAAQAALADPGLGTVRAGTALAGDPPGYVLRGGQGWTVNETPDTFDATDAESGGASNTDVGCSDAEITLELVRKNGAGPMPALRPKQKLVGLELYKNGNDVIGGVFLPEWQFPWARVTRMTNPVVVRGQVKYTVTVKNMGAFRGPGDVKYTSSQLAALMVAANDPDN